MDKSIIFIEGIKIEITTKNIKSIRLKVSREDGAVKVSAPSFVSKERIISFVKEKLKWIKAQQEKVAKEIKQTSIKLETGEKVFIFGKEYSIVVNPVNKNKIIKTLDGKIVIDSDSEILKQKLFDKLLKKLVHNEILWILPYYEQEMGIKASSFTVRKMKSRWGSCNPKTSKLCFNSELAKKPLECLKYVVVHELCHLKHANHQKEFWELVGRYCQEYKQVKKALKG